MRIRKKGLFVFDLYPIILLTFYFCITLIALTHWIVHNFLQNFGRIIQIFAIFWIEDFFDMVFQDFHCPRILPFYCHCYHNFQSTLLEWRWLQQHRLDHCRKFSTLLYSIPDMAADFRCYMTNGNCTKHSRQFCFSSNSKVIMMVFKLLFKCDELFQVRFPFRMVHMKSTQSSCKFEEQSHLHHFLLYVLEKYLHVYVNS